MESENQKKLTKNMHETEKQQNKFLSINQPFKRMYNNTHMLTHTHILRNLKYLLKRKKTFSPMPIPPTLYNNELFNICIASSIAWI